MDNSTVCNDVMSGKDMTFSLFCFVIGGLAGYIFYLIRDVINFKPQSRKTDALLRAVMKVGKSDNVKHLIDSGIDDENVLIAACLRGTEYEEDKHMYDPYVAQILDELADDPDFPKVINLKLRIKNVGKLSREARLVFLAEMITKLMHRSESADTLARGYHAWAYYAVRDIWGINTDLYNRLDKIFKTTNVYYDSPGTALDSYYDAIDDIETRGLDISS